jgi:hypothetical protein
MAAEEKGGFFPFVIESSGGWGAKATEFVETVIKAAADSHSAWCPHEVVHGIVRLVGVAVQRGNGWMAEGALPRHFQNRLPPTKTSAHYVVGRRLGCVWRQADNRFVKQAPIVHLGVRPT